jgi:signal transduction histidine kinase
LQDQREQTLERTANLLAALPPLMALMTSRDPATIQDASATFWQLSGGQMLILAAPGGAILGLHGVPKGVDPKSIEASLRATLAARHDQDWWRVGDRLFQVFQRPIYFGAGPDNPIAGLITLGFEVDSKVAHDLAQMSGAEVAFLYRGDLAVTTLEGSALKSMREHAHATSDPLSLGGETFLATSVSLSGGQSPVTLTLLKSFDAATRFLDTLNQWILGIGIAGVFAGAILVFLISTTFTRPLAQLVKGVQALESGDFDYPLHAGGSDEVSTLTAAFDRMRERLKETQQQMLASERLATIGRMATTISHDLRHPLTAILAYAEFLSEAGITEEQRKDFFNEIRIAVNRMTDELTSLLGFSKQGERLRPTEGHLEEAVEHAIQTVRVLPEFESVSIQYHPQGDCTGFFDSGKIERVIVNLVLNACEAVDPKKGAVTVSTAAVNGTLQLRVADNGPGIDPGVLQNLFQPFASHGKEHGIGLGLTVVLKIVTDHGGTVAVEQTGPNGTVFLVTLPARQSPVTTHSNKSAAPQT